MKTVRLSHFISRISGVSLIEVLVVLFIISVLTTLGLTTMQSVKSRSNDVACANNLRQLGQVALQFANDFDGYLPDVQVQAGDISYPGLSRWPQWVRAGNPYWYTTLNRYLHNEELTPPTGPHSIFQCPAAPASEQYVAATNGCSYVMNTYLGTTQSAGIYSGQPRLVNITQRARVALYLDGFAASVYPSVYFSGTDRDSSHRLRLRHGGRKYVNAVYLDGHVGMIQPIETSQGFAQQIWPPEARP